MKIKTGLAVGATVVALLAVGTGGAVAQSLVTSRDIKDGTVRVKDMRAGAIKQFSKPGPAGKDGAQGVAGKDGAQGVAGKDGRRLPVRRARRVPTRPTSGRPGRSSTAM